MSAWLPVLISVGLLLALDLLAITHGFDSRDR